MPTEGVTVTRITGDVLIRQSGRVAHVIKSTKLGVNVRCEVEAKESTYASVSDNPSPESGKQASSVTLFPRSKVVVLTGRGVIKGFEIIKGLVRVWAPVVTVRTPTVEFQGSAWVDVAPNGDTVVANTRDTIYNCNNRRAAIPDVNRQVLVTKDTISEVEPMDQRFYQAQKTWENLGAFEGINIYQSVADMSLTNHPLLAPETLEAIAKATGRDYDELRKETLETFQKQKQWAQTEADKLRNEAEKITQADFTDDVSSIPVNKTIEYQGIKLKIIDAKRELKQPETDLLSIRVEAKNESQKQVFIFWNEESRLINEEGIVFQVDDYNLETSYMTGTQAKGYLFFPINHKDGKFKLQLGKKSLPKTEVDIDLSKEKKEGS